MKIRSVGAELLHESGWTDREKDRQEEDSSRVSQFRGTRLIRIVNLERVWKGTNQTAA
jgi:hypothetical protein